MLCRFSNVFRGLAIAAFVAAAALSGCGGGYDASAIHEDGKDGETDAVATTDGEPKLDVDTKPERADGPFVVPALEELDASAEWIDQPVRDALEDKLAAQKGTKPQVTVDEALSMRNNTKEDNERILSALGRLPESPDQVDWDATIVRHSPADLKSTNPLYISSFIEMEVLDLVGLQLIGFDASFTPYAQKWAVKSWQVSKDRMCDKFVLRDDLTWSDGAPLTAHDVAFTFNTIVHPETTFPAVSSLTEEIRAVHAYDDHTLVMFHREPQASWTENIQFPVIPKHIYEMTLKEDYTLQNSEYHRKFEENPVTCGPYEYVKIDRGNEIVLSRRESWYMHDGKQVRNKPYAKEIRIRIIKDPNTWLLALKKGEIDECGLTSEQWKTSATNDDEFYKLNTRATDVEWTEFHVAWNMKRPYFSDNRVRTAMAYAFDHDEMLDKLFYGLYEPSSGVFHKSAWMAPRNVPKPYKRDLDKAEDLLDEAGWTDSDSDGIRDKEIDGELVHFEFELLCGTSPNSIKLSELIKDNLSQIGILCNVKPTEFTVLQQYNLDHNFDATVGAWGTGTDPSTLNNIFETGQERNYGQYSNPEVDRLFAAGKVEFDRGKRAEIYGKIHMLLWEDQPYMWLFWRNAFYGFNKRLRGYSFSPRGPYGVFPGFLGIWVPREQPDA
jgi:peptide/nickel transport system substrate-binding protein